MFFIKSLALRKLIKSASTNASTSVVVLIDEYDKPILDALRDLFTAFFASIPLDNYRKNTISSYEGFYASVVYAYFASLGLTVIPEDVMNCGRTNSAGQALSLYQIGIIFDEVERNVVSWEVEQHTTA